MNDSLATELSQESVAEGTSTLELARELHRAAWAANPGRTIYDVLTWEGLSPIAQAHLLDCAAAAEAILYFYDAEEQQLLTWNVSETVYRAYHEHPFSNVPDLPWITAPDEVKRLWFEYGKAIVNRWYLVKHLPQMVPWLNIEIDKNG